MRDSSSNIWIRISRAYIQYMQGVVNALRRMFGSTQTPTENYHLTHQLISVQPESFREKPTGIRLGRAIFVPLIILLDLFRYDTNRK